MEVPMRKNRASGLRIKRLSEKKKRRKKIIISILLIIIAIAGIAKYNYTQIKSKEMEYSVKKIFTTGLINKYKMYDVNNINLTFSDGKTAVVNVNGLLKKAPHHRVSYEVFLEKGKSGTWKVERVYNE